jgi:hypothetical protein
MLSELKILAKESDPEIPACPGKTSLLSFKKNRADAIHRITKSIIYLSDFRFFKERIFISL